MSPCQLRLFDRNEEARGGICSSCSKNLDRIAKDLASGTNCYEDLAVRFLLLVC